MPTNQETPCIFNPDMQKQRYTGKIKAIVK